MSTGAKQLGAEFRVNTTTTNGQEYSAITALADGGFLVTWRSNNQDGDNFGIYGQRYDAAGALVGTEFRVNTYTTSSQVNPSVTALTDGGFVVTWRSAGQDGDSYGIYGQRYDANGALLGTEFRVNTYTTAGQSNPSVTALADGGFVVTWESWGQDGSSNGIYGQRYDANGAMVAIEFQVNLYTTSDQRNPSVTALADGGFVVTWESYGQDGDNDGIFSQRYDSAGAVVGPQSQINTHVPSIQVNPSVTALADGGFVVMWTSYLQDGDHYGVYGQRYDVAGGLVGAEFQVNTYTTSAQSNPSVTALADGGFVVTWQSFGQDGDSYGIFGQRYDAAGAVVGGEFQVNTHTPSTQASPSVTALADGGFVVTWQSYGQDGDNYGVYGQQYAARLFGTAGEDIVIDTVGANWLHGQNGADILKGLSGRDSIFGGNGNDELFGGKGGDILNGGKGNDKLFGQAGKDKFVYKNNFDKDKIVDFQNNKDTILLNDNLWTSTKSVNKVLNQFGTQDGSDFVLNFGGGDILTIKNTTKSQLLDDIDIV